MHFARPSPVHADTIIAITVSAADAANSRCSGGTAF
jgi:hypothetical protein